MSVQIALPTSIVANHQTLHHKKPAASPKPKARSLSANTSAAVAAPAGSVNRPAGTAALKLHQRRRRAAILELLPPPPQIMLSEPPNKLISSAARGDSSGSAAAPGSAGKSSWVGSVGLGRREGLKLSFNRSISEPLGQHGLNMSPLVVSPPSVSPSLHPSKRCRMEAMAMRPPPSPLPQPCSSSPSEAVMATHALHSHSSQQSTLLRPPPNTVSLPNSPCSESSTLQRTILLQNARTVEPNALAAKLEILPGAAAGLRGHSNPLGVGGGTDVLIVDCRPFIAYNVSHVRGAINVNCCDRFNRKRLQQGKATLADLATTKEGKETLKRRNWTECVVYDDCSESLEKLPFSHTLFLVMNALVEDQRRPVMLLGGLRNFAAGHRRLCQDHLMKSGQSSASPPPPQRPRQPESSASSVLSASHLLPDPPDSPTELCDTKDIENHPTSQVLPYLFLGNMRDAADAAGLRRLGIKFVLNVTAKPPAYSPDPDIVYKQLEAADNGVQNLRQFFEEAFAFIDRARCTNSCVLIHCAAGVSRSPTIAVAYLMKYYPMAMSEAYKFVKRRRSIISPNLNFMGQLWEFEQGLILHTAGKDNKMPHALEMREGAKQESISKASNAVASTSWSEATSHSQAMRQPQDEVPANSGCSV